MLNSRVVIVIMTVEGSLAMRRQGYEGDCAGLVGQGFLCAFSSLVGLKKRETIAANLFLFRLVAIALVS